MEKKASFKWYFPQEHSEDNYKYFLEELMNAVKYVTDDFSDAKDSDVVAQNGIMVVNEEYNPYFIKFDNLEDLQENLKDMSLNGYEYPDDSNQYGEYVVSERGIDECCSFEIRSVNGYCGVDYVTLVIFDSK